MELEEEIKEDEEVAKKQVKQFETFPKVKAKSLEEVKVDVINIETEFNVFTQQEGKAGKNKIIFSGCYIVIFNYRSAK